MLKRLDNFHLRKRLVLFELLGCLILDFCILFYLGFPMGDLEGQWQICAYTLRGYDPFVLASLQESPLAELGQIPSNFSTIPWACTIGNLFYPGFLSFEGAAIYIVVFQFVICALAVWATFSKLKKENYICSPLFIALCFAGHFSFAYSLSLGNNGAIISLLMVIALCFADDRPYLSGIIIGLAMVKPQIAGTICIALLLNGKFKPLLVGAAIDIGGWLLTSAMTSTPFMDLLGECLAVGTSSSRHYYGVLSPLGLIGADSTLLLLINAVLGIGYTWILGVYLNKRGHFGSLISYVPACIASTIWTYKNGPDYIMVILATLLFVILAQNKGISSKHFLKFVLCIAFLQISRLALNVMQVIVESQSIRTILKSIEGLFLMSIGAWGCLMWVKYAPLPNQNLSLK